MRMDALRQHWDERQGLLRAMLAAHDAGDCEFRADLLRGRFWWQRSDGSPVVVANTRVLCSFALSNESVLMAWANQSLPEHARIPPVEGMDDASPADEEGAWHLARQAASASGAHFIYRAPNPQMWIFLGLWDVRSASPEDDPFVPGSPWEHVDSVLGQVEVIVGEQREDEARILLRNYGQTFVEGHVHRGTAHESKLREIGEAMIAAGSDDSIELIGRLAELRARAQRQMVS